MCGSNLTVTKNDLPFKVGNRTIVIVKDLPVYQCDNCHEYVLSEIDAILRKVDIAVFESKRELDKGLTH